jgi:hypothetical protein
MIRFLPKTRTSAAPVEQTGPPALPLAPRTPLAPPPAAPKLQRRRDSAVLPLPPSLLHPFTRSLLHSSTFSLVHLFPRSLAPLFPWSLVPCRGPRRQVFVAGVACSLLSYPTPHAFGAHPPCLSTHPLPQGLSGSSFSAPISLVPLVPWSLLLPHPPYRFSTPPPMPFCETVKL